MKKPLSLYIHVPFCTKKCPYCHFFVVKDEPADHQIFIKAIKAEWLRLKHLLNDHELVSLYFGGGTPSLLEGLNELLDEFSAPEITLEANPERLTKDHLMAWKKMGINRLSFGVQSFDDALLKKLGRTHDADTAEKAVLEAKETGFDNISIDLMYDLPDQTLTSWEETLKRSTSLPITHLSLYNLTLEPGTPFHRKRSQLLLPKEETSLDMLKMAVTALESAGLKRYEISAFAKKGLLSVHNTGYWTGRPFIGLGPSAFSYFEGRRFRNIAHFKHYVEKALKGEETTDFEEKLGENEAANELLALSLRLLEGTKLPMSEDLFNSLHMKGLIEKRGDRIALTELGLLHYDTVASEII